MGVHVWCTTVCVCGVINIQKDYLKREDSSSVRGGKERAVECMCQVSRSSVCVEEEWNQLKGQKDPGEGEGGGREKHQRKYNDMCL